MKLPRPRRTPPVEGIPTVSPEQSSYVVPTEANRLQRNQLVCLLDEALLIANPTGPIHMSDAGSTHANAFATD